MDDMSAQGSELAIHVDDGVPATITVGGDIDVDTSGDLGEAVGRVLRLSPTVERLVFDLADVTFMDSSGLAVLVRAENAGARVEVQNPSPAVRVILVTTGLQHFLEAER
jgi:anti-anti-sigma factor